MKKLLRKLIFGVGCAVIVHLILAIVVTFTISPKDALYPSSIFCSCGYREYLIFNGQRGVMWNMGHNRKDEYFKMRESDHGFDLLNWRGEKFAHIEFRIISIRWQNEGKDDQIIYREYNPYRLLSNWLESSDEPTIYESIEQKMKKAKTEPNKALEPTTMPVTFRAYARTAPVMVAAQF